MDTKTGLKRVFLTPTGPDLISVYSDGSGWHESQPNTRFNAATVFNISTWSQIKMMISVRCDIITEQKVAFQCHLRTRKGHKYQFIGSYRNSSHKHLLSLMPFQSVIFCLLWNMKMQNVRAALTKVKKKQNKTKNKWIVNYDVKNKCIWYLSVRNKPIIFLSTKLWKTTKAV